MKGREGAFRAVSSYQLIRPLLEARRTAKAAIAVYLREVNDKGMHVKLGENILARGRALERELGIGSSSMRPL